MPVYPTPHSPEWFRALEIYNRIQAAHTKKILELAGRDDVCSICGDDPAKDYKIVGEKLDKEAVATIRLCADCLITQSSLGTKYTPL